jgi:hypothetical protein
MIRARVALHANDKLEIWTEILYLTRKKKYRNVYPPSLPSVIDD